MVHKFITSHTHTGGVGGVEWERERMEGRDTEERPGKLGDILGLGVDVDERDGLH